MSFCSENKAIQTEIAYDARNGTSRKWEECFLNLVVQGSEMAYLYILTETFLQPLPNLISILGMRLANHNSYHVLWPVSKPVHPPSIPLFAMLSLRVSSEAIKSVEMSGRVKYSALPAKGT